MGANNNGKEAHNLNGCYLWYSVTQSLSNSLLGDVVLDSLNKVNRDKDSILDLSNANMFGFLL